MRSAILGLATIGLLAGCGGEAAQNAANQAIPFDTSAATAAGGVGGNGSGMTAIDASINDASGMPADSGMIRPPVAAGGSDSDTAPNAARPATSVVVDEAVTDTVPNATPPAAPPPPSAS